MPAPPVARWAWTVERVRASGGRAGGTRVHVYDCKDSPGGDRELNLDEALTELQRPGAKACKKCGAAEALMPLLDE
jgi:hypothetical protein